MDFIVTPVILLSTIACGLVAVLYLYGKLSAYLYDRSPVANKMKVSEWLALHRVPLPSEGDIVRECNSLAEGIAPVKGGVVSEVRPVGIA